MASILLVFLSIFMALTLATLLAGVFTMGKGGDFNKRNSNRLMRYRVLFQAGAVACFVLYVLVR